MNARPPLPDRLLLAITEHGPSSGSRLAIVVAANKAAVLRELRTNPMFEQTGSGPGSRWRLAFREPIERAWEPIGTDPGPRPREYDPDLAERLRALERRVAQLERGRVA